MATKVTRLCEGCLCRFDMSSYYHHFANDQCDWIGGVPAPLVTCDRHRHRCPLNDPAERERAGGWNSRQRDCKPIYVFRAGYILDDDTGRRIPGSWLTVGTVEPTLSPRPNAPRPPAALRGQNARG